MVEHSVAVIRGDGIGVEVLEEGIKVLNAVAGEHDITWNFTEFSTLMPSLSTANG